MDNSKVLEFSNVVRDKLLREVKSKAALYGVFPDKICKVTQEFEDSIIINGKPFDKQIKEQRKILINQIEEKGYDQVIGEVTYTWFNRLIALKFMEENQYLPVKVFSSKDLNKSEPDIITEAQKITFLSLDKKRVLQLKSEGKDEELYKYLILQLCHHLHEAMPFLFESINDYTEILIPERLLHTNSVLKDLNEMIPRQDWKEVEIIGWIYQDYIKTRKDAISEKLKKNEKIGKWDIPAATQIFTPKWIVKYMVENSLGRLWLESNPNPKLQAHWKYYIEQETSPLQERVIDPTKIKVLDPAMGSGHILVYSFEILFEIYKTQGYQEEQIAQEILQKNLYGLEIDDRAAELAGFALMMKARQYDKNIFTKKINLNVLAIQETMQQSPFDSKKYPQLTDLWNFYINAKNYGSILQLPKDLNIDKLQEEYQKLRKEQSLTVYLQKEKIQQLIQQTQIMKQKYELVITNPPYMGQKNMNLELKSYVNEHFPESKSDLFAVFIDKCIYWTAQDYYTSMITMQSWMFLSSYEKLRKKILKTDQINTMIHLGPRAFEQIGGEVVTTTTFVIKNQKPIPGTKPIFIRLVEYKTSQEKERQYSNQQNKYVVKQIEFCKIQGCPISYRFNTKTRDVFNENKPLSDFADPRQGLITGDNKRYTRLWFELKNKSIFFSKESNDPKGFKWFPFNKGGEYRKWYGNLEWVVNWENDGYELKHFFDEKGKLCSRPQNISFYFKEGLTWTKVSSSNFAVRWLPKGLIFSDAGMMLFPYNPQNKYVICSFLVSKIVTVLINFKSENINFNIGDVKSLPLIENKNLAELINKKAKECINISKEEWDSRETSWDFKTNELLRLKSSGKIEDSYNAYCKYWEEKFYRLHKNEEELNKMFIELYGLENELTPEVPLKDITILIDEAKRQNGKLVFRKDVVVRQFLSYFVGCMFGRYSLDKEGLILANQGETIKDFEQKIKKVRLLPDTDNIIPVLDESYFKDDIVAKFKEFLSIAFGPESLSQNLDFIAEALGGKGSSEQTIRDYFLKDFYKDHVNVKNYNKRPIYWLFTSGKEKAFNALVYMHRYDKQTLAKMRIDYLHALQSKLEAHKKMLQSQPKNAKTDYQVSALIQKTQELVKYDGILKNKADQYITIDLDDGVKTNYEKFKSLVEDI